MKSFIKDSKQVLKVNWLSLVIFELMYRIFTMILLMKYVNFATRLSLKKIGHSYLTAETFSNFIHDPVTVLFIIIGILLMAFSMLFEIQALFVCFESSWNARKTTVPVMIVRGAGMAVQFVRKYPSRCFIYLGLSLPYMEIHFIISEITQTRILQFMITQVGNAVPSVPLAFILIVIYFLSLLSALCLPKRVLMENSSDKNCSRFMKNEKAAAIRAILASILVQFVAALAAGLLYVLAMMFMVGIVRLLRASNTMVSAVLFYGNVVKYMAAVFVGGFGFTFSSLYLYVLYKRACSEDTVNKRGKLLIRRTKKSWFIRAVRSRTVTYVVTFSLLLLEIVYVVAAIRRDLPRISEQQLDVAVTAHRGGAKMAPENTLSSMKYAVEALADVAEIDVQETKDGEIVLLHDTNLKRTTGFNANIWDATYDQVSQLDAGAKFNKKFVGEQVPTLEEVLRYCKGKIKLNIEVKYNGHNKGIVKKVVNIITKNNFEEDCVVTSMNYKFLQQVKQENPNIKTGYTLRMTYGDLSDLTAADFFSVKHTYINDRFVRQVHEIGKEVHAWTLNYQGDMQRMVRANVNNIITDEPELVRRVVLGETDRNPSFLTLLRYALH